METLVQIEPAHEMKVVQKNEQEECQPKVAERVLRASSYIIYVDLPETPEEMLLVHGYTGAYDRVPRSIGLYIRSLETRRQAKPLYGEWASELAVTSDVPLPSPEDIRLLQGRGYLTRLSLEEEESLFGRVAQKMHEHRLKQMPSYIIMPTYDCNLRCSYCFQDHMRTDSKYQHLLHTMSVGVADRIFSSMKKIEALHGLDENQYEGRHRSIGLFGGEPLLAANRPIIEYILRKAQQIGTARFWAVSNATELDAYEDLLSAELIGSVQITLDGTPREHDQRRIYPNGSGSFAKIERNITMALNKGVNISIRMNVDRNNIGQLPELSEVIHNNGWEQYLNFSAYTSPIRAMNDKVARSTTLSTPELSKVQAMLAKDFPLASMFARPDIGIKQDARQIFHDGGSQMPTLHESYCSAHSGMYIFDAFADIYVCWDKTGDASTRFGHIHDDGNVDIASQQIQLWRGRTVASNPVCRKCRYALHCGGGCAVLAYRQSGKYHMNFCDGFASSFKSRVAEAYAEHVAGVPMEARAAKVCDQ
jgi:uncharacterized protein